MVILFGVLLKFIVLPMFCSETILSLQPASFNNHVTESIRNIISPQPASFNVICNYVHWEYQKYLIHSAGSTISQYLNAERIKNILYLQPASLTLLPKDTH